jgi:hypothetical protein
MSYKVVLTDVAIEDLKRIPPLVHEFIRAELSRLGEDPINVGRRSHFPYPQGLMHQFTCVADGDEHVVTILFKYADVPSENVIGVLGIAFQTIGPSDEDWSI